MSTEFDQRPLEAPVVRQQNKGRDFLSADYPIQRKGARYALPVRLPSYRSLPLSCIDSISLSIDGTSIDAADLRLVVSGVEFTLADLVQRQDMWWFVLDAAELVFSAPHPLPQGSHQVSGSLVTVEPYISNGRFHFTYSNDVELQLDEEGMVTA